MKALEAQNRHDDEADTECRRLLMEENDDLRASISSLRGTLEASLERERNLQVDHDQYQAKYRAGLEECQGAWTECERLGQKLATTQDGNRKLKDALVNLKGAITDHQCRPGSLMVKPGEGYSIIRAVDYIDHVLGSGT